MTHGDVRTPPRAASALIAAACFVIALLPVREFDPFWHLMLGENVLEYRARSFPEPVSLEEFGETAVAPEWLWDITTVGVHAALGWEGLSLLGAALAAAVALAALRLTRRIDSGAAASAHVLIGGLLAALALARLRHRPESAGLLCCALFVAGSLRHRSDGGRGRLAGLVGLALLWAQLHGSFVLAPVIFVLAGLRVGSNRGRLRPTVPALDLTGAALLVATWGTSAWGLGIVDSIREHSAGLATARAFDMLPLSWATLDPARSAYGPIALTLLALAALGLARDGLAALRPLLLLGLGLALGADAARFLPFAGLLAAPLALRGAGWLAELRPNTFAATAAAALLAAFATVAVGQHEKRGPLGTIGLGDDAQPLAAVTLLGTLPDVRRVHTSMDAGAAIGLALRGRMRLTADSRTPLHFGDADWAVLGAAEQDGDGFRRFAARYSLEAAVVSRESAVCAAMPEGWVPAALDPRFTTFVAPPHAGGLPSLAPLRPCGEEFVDASLCSGAAETAIARVRDLHDGPLAAYLAAEHALRCEGDAANAGVLVPSGVRTMDGPLRRLRARVAFARGDVDRAITLLAPAIAEGSLADLSLLAEPNATVPPDVALSLLQSAAAARPASTPADLHADLAQIAMAVGDLETARVHALGAAASGSSRTSELLTFLAGRTEAGAEAAQLAGWAAAAAPGAPDGVVHVDINTRLAEWTRDRTGFVDSKQDLVVGERATVHLHALGAGQTTPLHIHDAGDEVTLILSGRPDVSHVVPDGGALRTVERPASAMTLLWTGRSTGHQWSNAASPAPQGNLVFSFPAFQGNRYMPRWDDPRLHEGSAPADWTPAASIEEFASGARDLELLRVPLPQDGFHLLLLRGGTELPALPSPLVLYVFQGTGRLSLPGAPLPLGPSTFTYLPSAAAAGGRVEADGELAILIVALGR